MGSDKLGYLRLAVQVPDSDSDDLSLASHGRAEGLLSFVSLRS